MDLGSDNQTSSESNSPAERAGELAERILIAVLVAVTWWTADVLGPILFRSSARVLRATSIQASAQGVLMCILTLVLPLVGIALVFWMTREPDSPTWVRVFGFAIAQGLWVPRHVASSALSSVAASTYSGVERLILSAVGFGVAAWVLLRLALWLVRDEVEARAET